MEYKMMVPPFEMKSFDIMSKAEAKEHFHWFLSEVPNRIMNNKNRVSAHQLGFITLRVEEDLPPSLRLNGRGRQMRRGECTKRTSGRRRG